MEGGRRERIELSFRHNEDRYIDERLYTPPVIRGNNGFRTYNEAMMVLVPAKRLEEGRALRHLLPDPVTRRSAVRFAYHCYAELKIHFSETDCQEGKCLYLRLISPAFAACGHTSPVPHAAPTGLASRFRIRTR